MNKKPENYDQFIGLLATQDFTKTHPSDIDNWFKSNYPKTTPDLDALRQPLDGLINELYDIQCKAGFIASGNKHTKHLASQIKHHSKTATSHINKIHLEKDKIFSNISVLREFERDFDAMICWTRSAINCENWNWDQDQKECAEDDLNSAEQALSKLQAIIERGE